MSGLRDHWVPVAGLALTLMFSLSSESPTEEAGLTERRQPVRTDLYGDALPQGSRGRLGTMHFRPGAFSSSGASTIAFSSDGKSLASGGNRVRTWDVATGREIRSFGNKESGGHCVAFSPDGKILAVGAYRPKEKEHVIYLREVVTGKELRRFRGHASVIESIAFSADGNALASTGDGLRVWDTATGKGLHHFGGRFILPAFSPDSKVLASAVSNSKVVLRWDVATGRQLGNANAHEETVNWVSFSPDGKILISGGYDGIRLWDIATGKELRSIVSEKGTEGGGHCASLSPDGKALASGSWGGGIRLWDLTTGQEMRRLKGHNPPVLAIAFAPDGKSLASTGRDNVIRLWDVSTGRELHPTGGHQAPVWSVAFAPDGSLVASGGGDRTARLWNPAVGKEVRRLEEPEGDSVKVLAFGPDGKALFSAALVSADTALSSVRLWDVETGRILRQLVGRRDEVEFYALSPDMKTLAVIPKLQPFVGRVFKGRLDDSVHLWDLATGKDRGRLQGLPEHWNSVAYSPDGRTLAVRNKRVSLWDLTSSKERVLTAELDKTILGLAYSPKGEVLAVGSTDIYLFNTTTGKEVRRLRAADNKWWFYCIAFSPDGRLLAAASDDEILRVWNVVTGKEIGRLEGHRGMIYTVAFSPDGKTLASGSADTTVLIWEVASLLQ